MSYDGWNPLGGYRLLGGSLSGLIRWRYGLQNSEWFCDGFGDWIHFITNESEWLRGRGEAGALRELMDSNRSFPVTSTLRIVLAAFEILRHMLDFRSSMSCLGLGQHSCGWAI